MYKLQKITRKENTKIYFIIYSKEDIRLFDEITSSNSSRINWKKICIKK